MKRNRDQLTDAARDVIKRAHEEARRLGHDFAGTEHLMLAIASSETGTATDALRTLGVESRKIVESVEAFIVRGPVVSQKLVLPLTPRAKLALEHAHEEAAWFRQSQVDIEHILLGLLREGEGVGGRVLRSLGLELAAAREQLLKLRLLQIRIVERAVRPVRATLSAKRKMREELLAHLEAIYQEEREKANDPFLAIDSASKRFGDPMELSRELESSLTRQERFAYLCERRFGWRAPESASRYVFRQSIQLFAILSIVGVLAGATALILGVVGSELWFVLRIEAAFAVLTPLALFLLGILFFKMRDAQFGVFGTRRSNITAAKYTMLFAIVVAAASFGFFSLVNWKFDLGGAALARDFGVGIVLALLYLLNARWAGLTQITDTMWECMKLSD